MLHVLNFNDQSYTTHQCLCWFRSWGKVTIVHLEQHAVYKLARNARLTTNHTLGEVFREQASAIDVSSFVPHFPFICAINPHRHNQGAKRKSNIELLGTTAAG